MYDRENDNRNNNEGRQVQQELEDQLRAFGDTMTDAFAHGFEGRGMDIGDRAWDVGKAAVHAANYGIGEAAKAFRQGRRGYPYGDAKQSFREGAADADSAGMPGWFRQIFAKPEPTPVESIRISAKKRHSAGCTLLAVGITFACVPVEIMAASLGVRDFHVYVLSNGIFASAHLPGRDAVSLVRHVPTVSVHLGRVEAVNELSRELAAGRLGVVEAEARLNTARTLPRSTPQLEILACVVGSAGFAYLFGGTLADMPVAAVAGLLEALVCQQFARHGINRIFTDIVAAFCGTIWAIAVQAVVPAVNANAAIIGALMVLTPGVALTMGVRDILNGDYLSGSIRLLDALLIAGSIAGGVVLGWIMARGLGVA